MNIIVNADKNWAIGKNNSLLCTNPGRYEILPSDDRRQYCRDGKKDTGKLSAGASACQPG